MNEIIFAVCAVVITTASVFSIMHIKKQKKEYPCDTCEHLARKRERGSGSTKRYVCGKNYLTDEREFNTPPIYCKHYEKREQEEENS